MTSTARTRAGATFGLLSVIVTLAGLFIHGYPAIGASGKEIERWAATTNQQQFTIGIYIEALGTLCFLLFAAWLWSVAREAEGGSGWLSTAGFAGAVLYAAPIGNGVWWAVLDGGRRGTNAQTLTIVRDIAQHSFDISLTYFGAFLILTGYVLFTTRALPRWVGATAAVIGVGVNVPQTDQNFLLVFFLWSVVVSVYLLVRPGAAVTGREPSATAVSPTPVGTA